MMADRPRAQPADIDRRRALGRVRVRRHRARFSAGVRQVACDCEVAPGLRIRLIDVQDSAFEDYAVEAGWLSLADCDNAALVDAVARLVVGMLRVTRYNAVHDDQLSFADMIRKQGGPLK